MSATWGTSSFTGSFTIFNGEKADGPSLCFIILGDPAELLGESGGVLQAGNIEGSELTAATFRVDEVPGEPRGPPPLALFSRDFTCNLQLDLLKYIWWLLH